MPRLKQPRSLRPIRPTTAQHLSSSSRDTPHRLTAALRGQFQTELLNTTFSLARAPERQSDTSPLEALQRGLARYYFIREPIDRFIQFPRVHAQCCKLIN